MSESDTITEQPSKSKSLFHKICPIFGSTIDIFFCDINKIRSLFDPTL